MDKPISVGDLVWVAFPRPECGCPDRVGHIFKVTMVRPAKPYVRCLTCNARNPSKATSIAEGAAGGFGVGTHRLKRIPPLSELEGVKTEEEQYA